MSQLLVPIVSKFEGLLQSLVSAQDEAAQVAYAECLNHAMALARLVTRTISTSPFFAMKLAQVCIRN